MSGRVVELAASIFDTYMPRRGVENGLFQNHVLKRVLLAALVAGGTATSAMAVCPQMEFVVVDDQGPRTVTAPDGKVLHLKAAPLLTRADFTGANVTLTENQIVLNVNLDHDGAQRIRQFSKNNVGTTIAFIADGEVVRTAKILDPILFDGFLVGPLERAKAEALADEINRNSARADRSGAVCKREP